MTIHSESLSGMHEKVPENIPELRVGTNVTIVNKEHTLFLERGEIIEKAHKHYRVKIRSLDKKFNEFCLWFPEHWIDPTPKELISVFPRTSSDDDKTQ